MTFMRVPAISASNVVDLGHEAAMPTPKITHIALEVTGYCQLTCTHCYASSGPQGTDGAMSPAGWERVIDAAASLGVTSVQFIGGEPSLYAPLPGLIRHAASLGLRVEIFTNLVHVPAALWDAISLPGVSLATSWYSSDPVEHAAITGTQGSWRRILANARKAVSRGIPVRARLIQVTGGQDVAAARDVLAGAGVDVGAVDEARAQGRAGEFSPASLCGLCGDGQAAVLPDGTVALCVIGRDLAAGNVLATPLAAILAGQRWRDAMALVPPRGARRCPPADGNDCGPAGTTACGPAYS